MSITGMCILPHPVQAMEQAPVSGFSEAALLEKYPGATIYHVTPEEYPALERKVLPGEPGIFCQQAG